MGGDIISIKIRMSRYFHAKSAELEAKKKLKEKHSEDQGNT